MNNTQDNYNSISNIFLPVELSRKGLSQWINEQIDGTIFDDKIEENNLLITVTKSGQITYEIDGFSFLYRIPLHVSIKKEFIVGEVNADGKILITLRTQLSWNKHWELKSSTQILGHQWIQEPKAKLLGFRISIKSISDRILNNSKKKLTEEIDKSINKNFILKKYAQDVWNLIQSPLLISPKNNIYLYLTAKDFSLTKLSSTESSIHTTIFLSGYPSIGLRKQVPLQKYSPLILLSIKEESNQNHFDISTKIELRFEDLEGLIKNNFEGKKYPVGNQYLQILSIVLGKKNDKITLDLTTSGLYEGTLYVEGIPVFNNEDQLFKLNELAFSIEATQLSKSLDQIVLKGILESKLNGQLIWSIEQLLAELQSLIQKQLSNFQLYERIVLKGVLSSITLESFQIEKDTITLNVRLKGAGKICIEI